ncbi:MAG: excinuclease ABC subunit C [Bacteroidetes bacterium 43-93]|nr:GIY-YIG nuclease family protein [Bacteroidota bacterium]OJW99355.1 MAG: excinuclease ABC subunit C [Bacteroidetes bacterium 43-93]
MYKGGFVYIITNHHRTTLYIGVTSDLVNRVYEHKNHLYKNSFSDRYNLEFLVYYEELDGIEEAISREKQLKKWSRKKKEELVNTTNPGWIDLYAQVQDILLP